VRWPVFLLIDCECTLDKINKYLPSALHCTILSFFVTVHFPPTCIPPAGAMQTVEMQSHPNVHVDAWRNRRSKNLGPLGRSPRDRSLSTRRTAVMERVHFVNSRVCLTTVHLVRHWLTSAAGLCFRDSKSLLLRSKDAIDVW